MKGKYHVIVQNNTVKFQFDIDHNISVVRGNSATGKTTLVEMIQSFETQGINSGVTVSCTPKINVHVLGGIAWREALEKIRQTLVFIDEGNAFLLSEEFADAIHHSDNYYILFTRSSLPQLPYSVDAIYEIRKSGRYGHLKRTYNQFYRLYREDQKASPVARDMVNVLITEDNKAGFQFWQHIAKQDGLACVSAKGKSNIYNCLLKNKDFTLAIADGSAFGPEMEKVDYYLKEHPTDFLFLPESFEWLILNAEFNQNSDIRIRLAEPYNYAESTEFDSWEQFFTALLIQQTKDSHYQKYQKNRLNPYYLQDGQVSHIRKVLRDNQVDL